MHKVEIKSDRAPSAVGPYSQGIKMGRFIFLAGQIPIDPLTGEVVKDTVEVQTRRVLQNIKALLEAADAHMKDVVKATVYLTDLAAFSDMNTVYAEFFEKPFPARSTIQVSGLPKGVDVEIEVIASLGDE